IRRKPRLRTGDAEIRNHREAEPAADRGAVHRRDDRLLGAEQPYGLDVEMADTSSLLAGPLAGAVERAAVAEIRAGAERLALRRQHGRAATRVVIERLERARNLVDQRDIEEIVGRAPDLDQGNVARPLDRNILERTHVDPPSCQIVD